MKTNEVMCFHCGIPVPSGVELTVSIDGTQQAMCCHGCKAVANAIIDAGHAHFYTVRTEPSPTGEELIPEFLRQTQIYDSASVQKQFVHHLSSNICEASLILEGITCAACVWLNERHIAALPGVEEVQVNYATRRALIRWDESQIKLSEILQAIHAIGYQAHPYDPRQQQIVHQREQRNQLRRLAIAGVFGMQVMMLSISMYAGAWSGMEQGFETVFRWLGLGLTTPVMFFSATPFFRTAWRDLKHRQVGMDVPVSLGIGIAFAASTMATVTGQGHVYFDSVVMFVFFLLVSRYFEWMARQRGAESIERMAHALPVMATRLIGLDKREEVIAAAELRVGDIVLVRPGETIPADGTLLEGVSSIDESLLSGEALPVDKSAGDKLVGGSTNIENPLQMSVDSVGVDTVLAGIQRTIEHAQSDKPQLAQLADRVASRFVVSVLIIAVGVAVYWWIVNPERWLEVTLTVLIVTCPCALSLATPAAISAALSHLQRMGLLLTRGYALTALARVTDVVFDKTGTLTRGKPVLTRVICNQGIDESWCLKIASALERYSEHPFGRAIVTVAGKKHGLVAEGIKNEPGGGVCAAIDGQEYVIGNLEFVEKKTQQKVPPDLQETDLSDGVTVVALATSKQFIAMFIFNDEPRPDAAELIEVLKKSGRKIWLLTGDDERAARHLAIQVGIENYSAGMSPAQKVERVRAFQRAGAVVLMVGDGINDAPALSAADVSIAMGGATSLAKTSADIVLLSNQLKGVMTGLDAGDLTQRIIRQNFAWALGYNLCALPAAAMGLLTPWMAAIGMSLSSIIVVVNALRVAR